MWIPAPCGASNLCDYCAWRVARENIAVMAMDSVRHPDDFARVNFTLTTNRQSFKPEQFKNAYREVFRYLRHDRFDGLALRQLGLMEWTTGSGGHGRLPHIHGLLKGLDPSLATTCGAEHRRDRCGTCEECLLSLRWEKLTGGAWKVEMREIRKPAGMTAYVIAHHHKKAQGPPPWAKGVKRFRPAIATKERAGFFLDGVTALRKEAREASANDAKVKAAQDRLMALDLDPSDLDCIGNELFDDFLEQQHAQAPAIAVKRHANGALVSLSTGEVVGRHSRVTGKVVRS